MLKKFGIMVLGVVFDLRRCSGADFSRKRRRKLKKNGFRRVRMCSSLFISRTDLIDSLKSSLMVSIP